LFKVPIYQSQIIGNFEQPISTNKPGPGEGGKPHHVSSDRENEALQSVS